MAENRVAQSEDQRIDYVEEELLSACEYALSWFETWERHAPDECVFGGEHAVMQKLRKAIAEVLKEEG